MNTILTVRSEDFARIDEESRAVEFFQDLLWAEAARVGLPPGNVNISLKTKTSDGGVDATVQWPSGSLVESSIFANKYTAYQIKAGKSFEPWQESAIKKELFGKHDPGKDHLGVMVRDALDRDRRYVLVCFGHDLTSEQQGLAVKYLEAFLRKDCHYKYPQVAVWSRNNLASFLRPFPSLALAIKGISKSFQTHESWSKDAIMQHAFVPGESQLKQIKTLQEALRQNRFHLRVIGEAGIGKTRLVHEATKTDDLKPLIVYSNADAFWGSPLMGEIMGEDSQYSIILVLDECNPEKRSLIANKLKAYSPHIRMISIYTETDNASDVHYLQMQPLEENEISQIIQEYDIPMDQARKWAGYCDGSPRVAHVIGLNLKNNPEDMLREPDRERVWDRYIEGGDDPSSDQVRQRRLVLRYLALFKRFGFGQPVRSEAESIHELIKQHEPSMSWMQFVGIISELRVRKLLQGENTLYITPKLLHIKLWVEWWDTFGPMFTFDQILALPPSSLADWFFEMFEYAVGSNAAIRKVHELLDNNGPFQLQPEILQNERGARFFRYLGEVDPVSAVRCLQKTIGRMNKEELMEFRSGRREIIYLLERAARWRDLFVPSASLLLALAEAENEAWANNASGVFADLFTISRHSQLSVTEASPKERFPVLTEALSSESKQRRLLALQACDRSLRERSFGSVDGRVRIFGREPDHWTPATWGELFDAYRQVWKLLMAKVDELPNDERQKAADILVEHVRNLGAMPNLSEMIAQDALLLAPRPYVDDGKLLKVVAELLHYGKSLTSEVRELWDKVKSELTGSDYYSSMKRYVRTNLFPDDFDDAGNRAHRVRAAIQELAAESFAHPDLLADQLTWLVTPEAANGYQFGYALAQKDKYSTLLPQIINAAKAAGENANMYFLGGYLRVLFEDDPQAWENQMDVIAQEPATAIWILELTQRAGRLTGSSATRILQVLQNHQHPAWLLHRFLYGGILNSLPERSFQEWIEFLLIQTDPTAVYVALGLYSTYYGKDTSCLPPLELTQRLLTNEAFSSLPEEFQQGNNSGMYPYYWKEVAGIFISLYPETVLEVSAFVLRYMNRYDTMFMDTAPRTILRSIIARQPAKVWQQIVEYLDGSYAWELTQWLRGDNFFGHPREEDLPVLPLIPQDVVWHWVQKDVEERASYLATFVPPVLEIEDPRLSWARELLVRYGHRDDVRSNLWANFSAESWSGHASGHFENKRQKLLAYQRNETNANVNQWLDTYLENIEKQIADARIREERMSF